MQSKTALDADELLHLAVRDSKAGRHDVAIARLKEAANQAPENAKVLYMLAAEHAEIGLFDRAIEEMKRAVGLKGAPETAHLQLGLLYLMQGRSKDAAAAWEKLDLLGRDDALYLFKSALLKLEQGAPGEAIPLLEQAARNVRGNPALVNDIERVLANTRKASVGLAKFETSGVKPASHLLATKYVESGGDER